MSDRECSFASEHPQAVSSATSTPAHSQSPGQAEAISASVSNLTLSAKGSPLNADSIDVVSLAASFNSYNSPDQLGPALNEDLRNEIVNLKHMELLIHMNVNRDIFNLSGDIDTTILSSIQKAALNAPYLLYQLLAFSCHHLASLYSEKSNPYNYLAITLQTRAIALFNSAWIAGVNEENCAAVFLFASILGHHLFTDTLARRVPGGLESFLNYYTQSLSMHRNIYTIAKSAWPLFIESELKPMLQISLRLTSREAKGTQCQALLQLVNTADTLNGEDKDAILLAIRYLQIGFDVLFENDPAIQYQMLFLWNVVAPPRFTELLAERRPEALVVLAYYALLIHHGRHMWQVKDTGVYLYGLIVEHLNPGWEPWLEHPRANMAD